MKTLTEADLYEYAQMCSGKYGPQWTAIRKLIQEVRSLRRDLMETKPAGTIRHAELDAVLLSSTELHRALTSLISKLRPIPVAQLDCEAIAPPSPPPAPPAPSLATSRKLFSIRETADAMGLAKGKVYELVAAGRIQSIRLGSRRMIRPEHIDEFLAGGGDQR